MSQITYSGQNPKQLLQLTLRLLVHQIPFSVNFPKPENRHWQIWATNKTGRDTELIEKAWQLVQYRNLKIIAENPNTTIYLEDSLGYFVESERGVLEISLIQDTYYVVFGFYNQEKIKIILEQDMEIVEGKTDKV